MLEGVPDRLAQLITEEVSVPTIGIGAGPSCDGQVLVFHDLLGLHTDHLPKFVRQYAHLADTAVEALQRFSTDVQTGTFPADKESYHLDDRVFQELLTSDDAE